MEGAISLSWPDQKLTALDNGSEGNFLADSSQLGSLCLSWSLRCSSCGKTTTHDDFAAFTTAAHSVTLPKSSSVPYKSLTTPR